MNTASGTEFDLKIINENQNKKFVIIIPDSLKNNSFLYLILLKKFFCMMAITIK